MTIHLHLLSCKYEYHLVNISLNANKTDSLHFVLTGIWNIPFSEICFFSARLAFSDEWLTWLFFCIGFWFSIGCYNPLIQPIIIIELLFLNWKKNYSLKYTTFFFFIYNLGCACDVECHLYSFSFELNPSKYLRKFEDVDDGFYLNLNLKRCEDSYFSLYLRLSYNESRPDEV